MSRGVTSAVQLEVNKQGISPVFFVQFDFPTAVLRFWTGFGDLSWNGYTWTGAGNLIKFTGVEETALTQATGIQYELAGVNSSLVSAALDEDIQGRNVSMWMGFISNVLNSDSYITDPISGDYITDPDDGEPIIDPGASAPSESHMVSNDLIADPVGPFKYIMDTFVIDDKPEQPTITLMAESYLSSLDRPRPRRYTHEDQQIEFPSDMGFEFVASIQNKNLPWGANYKPPKDPK